ncbi:hypothetical protein [Bizionia paragorgiae]|uniref:Lipocalin-like domain-containing protein n=1 Tax=Bizionia paragorgiae TaxID=283786 RepID=A0A1H4C4T2_BIZPA|nr:hypothetical protein [Bizionia paragorgiae]SEA55347.1 hypothetical protein SAMN04487990_1184 [Bizionia paragorgiae]
MNFKINLLFLSLLIVVLSCSDNDNDTENNLPIPEQQANSFFVNETEYILTNGTLENYGVDNDPTNDFNYQGSNFDLYLTSENIEITSDNNGVLDLKGYGQLLYFELFSENENDLSEGDYTASNQEPYSVFTYDIAEYSIDFDEVNRNTIEVISGTLNIRKVNNEYEITINLTDINGDSVVGYYKGTLQHFNYN